MLLSVSDLSDWIPPLLGHPLTADSEHVSCHLDVVDTKKRSYVSQMGSTLRQEKIKICAACVLLLAFLNQL